MRVKICFMMLSVMVAVSTGFAFDISAYGYESPLQQAYMESHTDRMAGEISTNTPDQMVTKEHIQKAAAEADSAIEKQKQAEREAEEQARREAEAAIVCVQNTAVSTGTSERELLAKIVMAEAGCEDLQGQIMVVNVILNRLRCGYGSSITDIIMAPGQFQPVSTGIIWGMTPTASVYEAVDRGLAGEDYSMGALYFVSAYCDYSWFMSDLTFVTQHGGHMFFR